MNELICINDKHISREIKNQPKEGNIYTIRKLVRNPDRSWGILLNEVVNRKHRIIWDFGMVIIMEPNFEPSRFTTLDGKNINCEELFYQKRIKQKTIKTIQ